jgi:Spy/CpxP family protein refolding chaperone
MKQVLLFLPLALLLATAPMLPSVAGVTLIAQQQDRMGAQLEQLKLSESQKAKIASIRATYRQELQAVLTPEQWQQWQQARQNGQRPDVNLSDDQEAKIKTLRQKNRSQIEAVLTPEQRQQWAKIRPARQ